MSLFLIDPFSGASGDMLLSALVDAGLPIETLNDRVLTIPVLSGVKVTARKTVRGPFAATQLDVSLPASEHHRGFSTIKKLIEEAPSLGPRVRKRAVETFRRLAEAEARVHGVEIDEIHFHEVGALDAIFDVVGFFVAVEALGIEEMRYTRLILGRGKTSSQHGEIPVPSPATLELLKGHRVAFSGREEELVTPTAAAIIATAFEPLGEETDIVVTALGYGAGTRESGGLPNILRVALGEAQPRRPIVSIIRTTIDDMNPELYGHVMNQLFENGALEVYYHPVMMKKNRPGTEVTVIAEEPHERDLAGLLMKHTTTIGVRIAREERVELPRRRETVSTELGDADVKVATLPDGAEKMSPEYESCRALAEKSGVPVIEVFESVRRAWEKKRR